LQFIDLASVAPGTTFEADVAIIGSGPAGLAIAKEFLDSRASVLVVESGGFAEEARFAALNVTESLGDPARDVATRDRRTRLHGTSAPNWTDEEQPYGARCRVFGGSSQVWAGKSATFDKIVFDKRDWVPHSGWPIAYETLAPYFDRAAELLNLGPNCYGDGLWKLMGRRPQPEIDRSRVHSFFWQFARSRVDRLDVMRFGRDLRNMKARNVRVILNATATNVDTNEAGTALYGFEVSTIDGARSRVRARCAVLACGAIENARLMLASRRQNPDGLGNSRGLVGRFLMDHPGTRLGGFTGRDTDFASNCFGFCGVREGGRAHLYMHGLALSEETQRREGLLNCAVYMLGERAVDDPLDALKRILRRESPSAARDLLAAAAAPQMIAKGLGMRIFQSAHFPEAIRERVVDLMISANPNYVAREYHSSGLPHKLVGVSVDGITEQAPNPENRISLAGKTDPLGVPLARATWRVGELERRTLARIAEIAAEELRRAGLPTPTLEGWVVDRRLDDAVIVDMCHSSGTTRMADDPCEGVVDANCRVHGIDGLFVAGGSVLPTLGHANPTLMIVALAIRLADRLKSELSTYL
jgi:choline dehydrogenase-like flavoprotein